MKKTLIATILTLAVLIVMPGLFSLPAHAKSNNYWISGYCGGMGLKQKKMNAAYKGNTIRISGYGSKSQCEAADSKTKKLKARTYKISNRCKVGAAGCEMSYKRFLKEEGRKGRLEGFADIRVLNNVVVYIDYGF